MTTRSPLAALAPILSCFVFFFVTLPSIATAAADKQAFLGGGVGFEVLTREGSGTGFYLQGHGGYAFDANWAAGLHVGYSKVSSVNIKALDFGAFGQLTDPESGLYGRLYLDLVHATVPGGHLRNGVDGTDVGVAPGAGMGIVIPSAGSFHMVPELAYRVALLEKTVSFIAGTFSLVWDF